MYGGILISFLDPLTDNKSRAFDPGHVLWSVAFTVMEKRILPTVETPSDGIDRVFLLLVVRFLLINTYR